MLIGCRSRSHPGFKQFARASLISSAPTRLRTVEELPEAAQVKDGNHMNHSIPMRVGVGSPGL